MKSEVATFIATALAKHGVAKGLGTDLGAQTVASLGLDSLDFMELLNEIEEEFEVRIEDDTVAASTTVAELIAFIEGRVAARRAIRPADRT